MNLEQGVFKIQLPDAAATPYGDVEHPKICVSNENGTIAGLLPMDPTILMLFPKQDGVIKRPLDRRIYVVGQFNELAKSIHINMIIPDQGW